MRLCDAPVIDDGGEVPCGAEAEWETPTAYYCRQHKHRIHAEGETRFRRVGELAWTYVRGGSVVG